jgi:hypothetical protein
VVANNDYYAYSISNNTYILFPFVTTHTFNFTLSLAKTCPPRRDFFFSREKDKQKYIRLRLLQIGLESRTLGQLTLLEKLSR